MKILRKKSEKAKKIEIKKNIPDYLMIIGFISAMYGIHCIYPPAMWIIGGSLLIFVGYPRKGVE